VKGRAAGAALFFLFATILFTWPFAAHVSDGLGDIWDAKLNAWILHWDFHQTFQDPMRLFDANIFHPARYALAFSENLYGASLFGFPLYAASVSTLAAYNVLFLLGMFLSAMAAWALAFYVTRDAASSLIAGVVFAFVPWRIAQIPHIQYQWGGFLALSLLFVLRYLDEGRSRDLLLFGVFFAWNAVTNVHYALFLAMAVGVVLALEWLAAGSGGTRRRVTAIAGATAVAAVLVAPFYVPYAKASELYRMTRGEDEIAVFSGRPIDFLTAGPQNKLYAPLTQKLAQAEGDFFPGIAVVILAAVALFRGRGTPPPERRSASPGRRRAARVLDAIAAAGFLVWVYLRVSARDHIGPVSLRDPGRILFFVTFAFLVRLALAFPARSRYSDVSDFLRRTPLGTRRMLLVAVAATGVVVALGMHTPYYRFLVQSAARVFHALRVPSRGIVLFDLAIGVLAACGLSLLAPRRRWPIAAALAVTAFEYRASPVDVSFVERDPAPVYRWLAGVPLRGAVIEWPFGGEGEVEYEFRSTAHWKPLVNGYSGFGPPAYQELAAMFAEKPIREDVWRKMREAGACLLIVHPRVLPPESRSHYVSLLRSGLDGRRLEPIKTFPSRDGSDLVFRLEGCAPFETGIPAADQDSARRQTLEAFGEIEGMTNPPFGVIDAPKENQTAASGSWGYGWALDDSGIAQVLISVDGGAATPALIHQPHPGVRDVHPNYPDSDKPGFGFALPTLAPGPHKLSVTLVARDGGKTELKHQIQIR
jgi:hypothetical protein